MPWKYREVGFFFLIGGYSSAKSFSDVALILKIAAYYQGHYVTVGLGSISITFFKKTIGNDLEKILITSGIKYRFDGQENCYIIGSVKFYIIPIEQPKNIFGYNYNIFISDEQDELPQDKCIEAFGAIKERCRVPLPAVTDEEKSYKKLYEDRMASIPREEWDNDKQILEWRSLAHRKPYAVFTTTAQGLKGIFRIVEMLKEKKLPYILIRALTKDNIYNDPSYYEDLYKIYTELERMAFLEGRFVNLTSGRVYPSFDETLCTVPDIELTHGETVYIGQDMNNNASCATAFVKRDKVLYITKGFCFKDFTKAAEEIRRVYPTQRIPYYPDASGKMIIQAQMADFAQHDLEVQQSNINPPISERIFIVNKMLSTGRLKICQSVKELAMAWKTRCYDKNGEPEKATRHPEPSDWCDSSEYALWRIVSSDSDYSDLYSLTRSFQKNK
jgi:hypothetical protein